MNTVGNGSSAVESHNAERGQLITRLMACASDFGCRESSSGLVLPHVSVDASLKSVMTNADQS